MRNFKQYQYRRILTPENRIAHGDYKIEGITIRLKNGFLDDSVDDEGNNLPAIETDDRSHIEHWKNGVLHCENQPAVIDNLDNYEEWWFNGILIPPRP